MADPVIPVVPDDETLRRILAEARTIAVVGLSSKPGRASLDIGHFLQERGYRIIPVNPRETEVLGETAYPSLRDIPEEIHVDIVDVFRRAEDTPEIARDAVAIGAKNMWCQYNVISEEGARIAEAGGLSVVMDRCIKVEHARYVGRMHWLGFNTQRITSVRGGLQ